MTEGERLTRLEERYAHLSRHVTEQDKAMLELGEELEKLRRQLASFQARLDSHGPETGTDEKKPPHY